MNPSKELQDVIVEVMDELSSKPPAPLIGKQRAYISQLVVTLSSVGENSRWPHSLVYILRAEDSFGPYFTGKRPCPVLARWIFQAVINFPHHSLVLLSFTPSRGGFASRVDLVGGTESLSALTSWLPAISTRVATTNSDNVLLVDMPLNMITFGPEVVARFLDADSVLPSQKLQEVFVGVQRLPSMNFTTLVTELVDACRRGVLDGDSIEAVQTFSKRFEGMMTNKEGAFIHYQYKNSALVSKVSYLMLMNSIVAALQLDGQGGRLSVQAVERWVTFELKTIMRMISEITSTDTAMLEFLDSSFVQSLYESNMFSVYKSVESEMLPTSVAKTLESSAVLVSPKCKMIFECNDLAAAAPCIASIPTVAIHSGRAWMYRSAVYHVLEPLVEKALRAQLQECITKFAGVPPKQVVFPHDETIYAFKEDTKAFLMASRDRAMEILLRPPGSTRREGLPDGISLPDMEDLCAVKAATPLCVQNAINAFTETGRIRHEARYRLFEQLLDFGYETENVVSFVEHHAEKGIAKEYGDRVRYERAQLAKIVSDDDRGKRLGCGNLMAGNLTMARDGNRQATGCPFKFAKEDDLAELVFSTGVSDPAKIVERAKTQPKVACLMHANEMIRISSARKSSQRRQERSSDDKFPFDSPRDRFYMVLKGQQGK